MTLFIRPSPLVSSAMPGVTFCYDEVSFSQSCHPFLAGVSCQVLSHYSVIHCSHLCNELVWFGKAILPDLNITKNVLTIFLLFVTWTCCLQSKSSSTILILHKYNSLYDIDRGESPFNFTVWNHSIALFKITDVFDIDSSFRPSINTSVSNQRPRSATI